MRVVPRGWDNETWVCSLRGHVVPAARVRRLDPGDASLGIEVPGGGRLACCSRCDLWPVWAKRLFGLRGGAEAVHEETDCTAVLGAPPSAAEEARC